MLLYIRIEIILSAIMNEFILNHTYIMKALSFMHPFDVD